MINMIYHVNTYCVLDLILNNGFAHVCNATHNNINYNYDLRVYDYQQNMYTSTFYSKKFC